MLLLGLLSEASEMFVPNAQMFTGLLIEGITLLKITIQLVNHIRLGFSNFCDILNVIHAGLILSHIILKIFVLNCNSPLCISIVSLAQITFYVRDGSILSEITIHVNCKPV